MRFTSFLEQGIGGTLFCTQTQSQPVPCPPGHSAESPLLGLDPLTSWVSPKKGKGLLKATQCWG